MNDLAQRCREILHWRRKGVYEGTALKAVADVIEDTGGSLPMREAEDATVKEALTMCAAIDEDDALVERILRSEVGDARYNSSEWRDTRTTCERALRVALALRPHRG